MGKNLIAITFGLALLFFAGCSSADGTVTLKELQQTIEQRIGQEVVIVGSVDVKDANLSAVKLFKLYKGSDTVLVSMPEGELVPHQGLRSRVTGVVAEKDFPAGVGRRVYVEAKSVRLE